MSLQHNFTKAEVKDENLEVSGVLKPAGSQVIHVTIAHGDEVQSDVVPPTRLVDEEWDLTFNPRTRPFATGEKVLVVGVAVVPGDGPITWHNQLTIA